MHISKHPIKYMPSHAHDRRVKRNFFLGGETQIYINQTVSHFLVL